jgi:hypothetical protein
MRSILHAIDAEHRRHAAELDRIADRARAEVIEPFCRKHGYTFSAGMGTWCFWQGGRQIDAYDLERMRGTKRVLTVLQAEYTRDQDFGAMISDVK